MTAGASKGRLRIVGGRHRGRKLEVPAGERVRPTSERVREAVFDILGHRQWANGPLPEGARVVDAFAGCGALGLEALSRGAAEALFLEADPRVRRALNRNIDALDEAGRAFVLPRDATYPGPRPGRTPFALVFADAPYGSGLGTAAIEALAVEGWLAEGAVAVVELGGREGFAPPAGCTVVDQRRYGRTRLVFLEYTAA